MGHAQGAGGGVLGGCGLLGTLGKAWLHGLGMFQVVGEQLAHHLLRRRHGLHDLGVAVQVVQAKAFSALGCCSAWKG